MRTLSFENPVLLKEMRSRMRGARAYWIMAVYVAFLSVAFMIVYATWAKMQGSQYSPYRQASEMSSSYFTVMSIMQVLLGALLAPAFTCGAITLEREQQTLELLLISLVDAKAIITGKLASALSYVVLLAVCSMPLLSVCFLFGGVAPGELMATYFVILVSAFFFGIVGLFCTTHFRRTTTATAIAYVITLFFVGGSALADVLIQELMRPSYSSSFDFVFMYVNPIAAVVSVRENIAPSSGPPGLFPFWLTTCLIYALLAIPLVFSSTKRLKA